MFSPSANSNSSNDRELTPTPAESSNASASRAKILPLKSSKPSKIPAPISSPASPRRRAAKYGIMLDAVTGGKAKVNVMKGYIEQINSQLIQEGKSKLKVSGNKTILQERLYDFLGVEKGKEPETDIQETTFLTIDKGFEDSFRYHNKPASEKSFEDCDCERCRHLEWEPAPLQPVDTIMPDAEPTQAQQQINIIPSKAPMIPYAETIVDAVKQVQNGTISEFEKYKGTPLWEKYYKQTVSRRKVFFFFFFSPKFD